MRAAKADECEEVKYFGFCGRRPKVAYFPYARHGEQAKKKSAEDVLCAFGNQSDRFDVQADAHGERSAATRRAPPPASQLIAQRDRRKRQDGIGGVGNQEGW